MKPHYKLIAIFILIGIIFACIFVKCEPSETVDTKGLSQNEVIKKVVKTFMQHMDSTLKVADKKETERIKYVDRWRTLKGRIDSIPCDSAIVLVVNMCDTIIMQDSSQIATLKDVIKLDSNIIANYERVVKNDSLHIESLKKEVKKHKRQKRAALIVAAVFGGIAIIK